MTLDSTTSAPPEPVPFPPPPRTTGTSLSVFAVGSALLFELVFFPARFLTLFFFLAFLTAGAAYLFRMPRLLKAFAIVWLVLTGLAVFVSPFISLAILSRFTPVSVEGRQWFNTGGTFALAIIGTLAFLTTQVAAGLTLYFWSHDHATFPPNHLCPNCRYDLRATPNPLGPLLDRCPECGYLR